MERIRLYSQTKNKEKKKRERERNLSFINKYLWFWKPHLVLTNTTRKSIYRFTPFSPNLHATHHQISTSSSSSSSPPSPPAGPSAPSSTPRLRSPFLPLSRTPLPSQPPFPSSPTPFPPPIASIRSDWSPLAPPACSRREFDRTTTETRDSPLYIPSHTILASTHNRGSSSSQSESASHPHPNSTHCKPTKETRRPSKRSRSMRWRATRAPHRRETKASRFQNRRSTKTGKCPKRRSTIRTSPAMRSERKTNVGGMERPLLLALRVLHASDIVKNWVIPALQRNSHMQKTLSKRGSNLVIL